MPIEKYNLEVLVIDDASQDKTFTKVLAYKNNKKLQFKLTILKNLHNQGFGGNVKIGDYSAIGIGTNILHSVNIGCNCIIGGGSLVCHDTNENSIYYGSPSKFIRKHKIGDKYL